MKLFYKIIIDVIVSLLVGLFIGFGAKSISLGVATGIMSALMAHIVTFIEYEHKQERKDLFKKISDKMERTIEHAAFYTENGKLEEVIESLRRISGRKMWIVAKFISKQLSNSLSSLRIEIGGHDYSMFAAKLYADCEKSIFLTCPFTPEEWFAQLLSADKISKIQTGQLSVDDIPWHVKVLLSSPAETKRRLIILNKDKWDELCDPKKIRFLKEFIRVNKGIDNRFIKRDLLQKQTGYDYNYNLDFAIFDRQLFLIWERPSREGEKMPLTLETKPPDEAHAKLVELFDFPRYKAWYKTGEDLLGEIERNVKKEG